VALRITTAGTRLAGYRRKSAVGFLSNKAIKELAVYAGGEAVKLKPEKSVRRTVREAAL
jgi:hypothetical protein